MNVHVKAVSSMWALIGAFLGAQAIWGLLTESHYRGVVESWLMVLAFGAVAIGGAVAFARGRSIGRWGIRIVSVLALLYSAMWLLLGGAEDASGYWLGIVVAVIASVYGLIVARKGEVRAV
jgi:hypothetical protein